MTTVCIGNHSKIVAGRTDRDRIRSFYRDVLGCSFTKLTNDVDYVRFPDGFFLAVLYQDAVPSAEELRRAIWLELKTEDPKAVAKRIVDFDVYRIEMPHDVDHLYFQAPGGQVFRVVGREEDLSRFEK